MGRRGNKGVMHGEEGEQRGDAWGGGGTKG